jgi:hypothetical protein
MAWLAVLLAVATLQQTELTTTLTPVLTAVVAGPGVIQRLL